MRRISAGRGAAAAPWDAWHQGPTRPQATAASDSDRHRQAETACRLGKSPAATRRAWPAGIARRRVQVRPPVSATSWGAVNHDRYPAPFLRHPSPRGRRRHPRHPSPARAQPARHDRPLRHLPRRTSRSLGVKLQANARAAAPWPGSQASTTGPRATFWSGSAGSIAAYRGL